MTPEDTILMCLVVLTLSPLFKVSSVKLESTALLSGSSILGQDRQHPPSQSACEGAATWILQQKQLSADGLLSTDRGASIHWL